MMRSTLPAAKSWRVFFCWAAVRKRLRTSTFTGKAGEALHGRHIVLLRQNRGGHQNGHLLAVQHGLHGRPEGDLGLAEAHVAAEEAIHGGGALHVLLDLGHAAKLILGLGVGKALFKLPLHGVSAAKA